MAPFRFFTAHRHLLQMYFALSTLIRKGKLFSSSFTLKASLPLVLLLLSTKFLSLFLSVEVWQTTHNLSAIFFHCFVAFKRSSKQKDEARALPLYSCTTTLLNMTSDLTTVQIVGRAACRRTLTICTGFS